MAFRATNNAIVIDRLIADLVQEVIDEQGLLAKESQHTRIVPCQRLFDLLGIVPCGQSDDDNDTVSIEVSQQLSAKMANPCSDEPTTMAIEPSRKWDRWLSQVLATDYRSISWILCKYPCAVSHFNAQLIPADSSEDDLEIYRKRKGAMIELTTIAIQTEPPRKRIREQMAIVVNNRATQNIALSPCELTHHIVYIDAISIPTPNLQNRPPLADRFCYMLTDFASALYCSLAIMCCCTPSMLR